MKIINYTITAIAVMSANISFAQINETKLVPDSVEQGDYVGYSVACDNNFLVFSALYSDDDVGGTYVYENIGGLWTEKSKLLASDGAFLDEFGWTVSIDGNYILVGARKDDNQNGTDAGSAYIFKYDTLNAEWTEQAKLVAPDGSAYDRFGWSLFLFGDYALIGAPGDSMETGSVYLFKRQDTTWTQEAKLLPINGIGASLFGCSVAMFGDYAVIGAFFDEEIEEESGAVYIFYKNGGSWIQQAKLHSSEISSGDYFGYAVSISGDYIVVGAPGEESTIGGAAYIFHRNGPVWTEQAVLRDSTANHDMFFGRTVSIDGDYLVIGAPQNNTQGNDAGCAYLFKQDGNSWSQIYKLLASDGIEGDIMGWSVFIENDEVFSGSILQYNGGLFSGALYVYDGFVTDLNENTFSQITDYKLQQNYPNPFNPSTKISWQSPIGSWQTLKVYDVLGNEVVTLVNEYKLAGRYEVEFSSAVGSQQLASGIYFYRLMAGDFTAVKKMILIK